MEGQDTRQNEAAPLEREELDRYIHDGVVAGGGTIGSVVEDGQIQTSPFQKVYRFGKRDNKYVKIRVDKSEWGIEDGIPFMKLITEDLENGELLYVNGQWRKVQL